MAMTTVLQSVAFMAIKPVDSDRKCALRDKVRYEDMIES